MLKFETFTSKNNSCNPSICNLFYDTKHLRTIFVRALGSLIYRKLILKSFLYLTFDETNFLEICCGEALRPTENIALADFFYYNFILRY